MTMMFLKLNMRRDVLPARIGGWLRNVVMAFVFSQLWGATGALDSGYAV